MTGIRERLLFDRRYSWMLHVAFWLFVYLDLILDIDYMQAYWDEFLISTAIDITVIYFNLYYLIPKFLLRKKYLLYLLLTFGCVIILVGVAELFDCPFCDEVSSRNKIIYFVEAFVFNAFIVGFAIGLKLFKTLVNNRMKLEELNTLKTQSELNNLKKQINPHFLFNTMNSMYVMAQKGDERLPDTILDLSDLMRFQLHQGSKSTIGIGEEFKFIKNYIKFEQLRRSDLTVNINESIQDPSTPIPPLILLCFVENAMKHSKSMDNSPNTVEITIKTTDTIQFDITNKIGDFQTHLDDPDKGIGQANVKKRLDLIYGSDYTLAIDEDNGLYSVSLTLPSYLSL